MAGKSISSLSIALGLTSKPVVSAIGSIKGAFGSLTSSVGSAGSSILKFTGIGGAIAAIAGGAGIGLMVNNQLEAIDTNAKLADRLGTSTEALAGLQHAASLAGVSDESLTGSMEKMLKSLGGVNEQGEDTKGVFTRLGLSAEELANMPTDQAFSKIADGISAIQNPTERATAEMAIFGKSGQSLGPLLTSGAAGIKAAMQEADALGLSFSRIDAAKVEEANDAVTRMKSTVTGVFRAIAIAIAPALTSVATSLMGVGIKVVSAVKAWLPGILAVSGNIWSGFTAVFGAVYSFIAPIVSGIFSFISANFVASLTSAIGFGNSVWNVFTALAGVVMDIVSGLWSVVSPLWNSALDALGINTASTGSTVTGVFQTIVSWGRWLQDGITTALNVIAYSVKNWQLTFQLAGAEVVLAVVKTGNQIAYVFTEVIPALLSWFVDNWQDIFKTIGSFTAAVFTNMATNVGNFFSALFSALKGDGFNFQWTGLTEGFKNTIKELPKIAEREAGPLEAALQANADALRDQFGDGLAGYLKDQDSKVKGAVTGLGSVLDTALPKALDMPKIPTPVIPDINTDTLDKTKKKAKDTADALELVTAGSAESQKLRYEAMFTSAAAGATGTVSPTAAQIDHGTTTAMQQGADYTTLLKQLVDLATARNIKLDKIEGNTDDDALSLVTF